MQFIVFRRNKWKNIDERNKEGFLNKKQKNEQKHLQFF